MIDQGPLAFNLAVQNSNVRAAARFASQLCRSFCAEAFISTLARSASFPFVSIGDMIRSLNAAGAYLRGSAALAHEIYSLRKPALLYIRRREDQPHSTDLMEFGGQMGDCVHLIDCNYDKIAVPKPLFETLFEGIVLHGPDTTVALDDEFELTSPSLLSVIPFLSTAESLALREICQEQQFYSLDGNDFIQHDMFRSARRNFGHSAFIAASMNDITEAIFTKAALALDVSVIEIEGLHVRKLDPLDVVPPCFDNGVNLQRIKALHFCFGDSRTLFNFKQTCSGRSIDISEGVGIVISCGDETGRTQWESGWTGEATSGVCYLGSCWQRLPLG